MEDKNEVENTRKIISQIKFDTLIDNVVTEQWDRLSRVEKLELVLRENYRFLDSLAVYFASKYENKIALDILHHQEHMVELLVGLLDLKYQINDMVVEEATPEDINLLREEVVKLKELTQPRPITEDDKKRILSDLYDNGE